MSLTVYRKQLKTGGGATALDGIDGAILLNLDECTVYQSGVAYTYVLNATSGAADDGINIIAPDTNPGTKRWILNKSYTLMTDDEAVPMSSKAPKASPTFTGLITNANGVIVLNALVVLTNINTFYNLPGAVCGLYLINCGGAKALFLYHPATPPPVMIYNDISGFSAGDIQCDGAYETQVRVTSGAGRTFSWVCFSD